MKEFEIVVNEETEIISVNDFFTFSIKYHNLSSISDTITESEKIIVRWCIFRRIPVQHFR